jgi:hypothetical protein
MGETLTVVPLREPGIQVYVVAPVPVIEVDVPAQIVAEVVVVPTAGGVLLTVTSTLSVAVHPFAVLVTVTVYVVVDVGLAIGWAIFVALNPAEGVHVYVLPPIAAMPMV